MNILIDRYVEVYIARQLHSAMQTNISQVPGTPRHRDDGPMDPEPTMVQRGWGMHTGILEPGRVGWDLQEKCKHHGSTIVGRGLIPAPGLGS